MEVLTRTSWNIGVFLYDAFFKLILGTIAGTVEELNYANDLDKSYPIVTDCQFIDIDIKLLDLEEEYDYLHIGENHYTGSLSPFQVIYFNCLNLQ